MTSTPRSDRRPDVGLESTADLFQRIQSGDEAARERLIGRYLTTLRRFAHGRIPGSARSLIDTDDLVQTSLLRAMGQLSSFENRREGAFLAYLRQILVNRLRDQVRTIARRPEHGPVDEDLASPDSGPEDDADRRHQEDLFETAMTRLSDDHREAVVLRIELGLSYQAVAEAMGRPSAEAARKLVARALTRLADELPEGSGAP